MLSMFTIAYKELEYELPAGWITPFAVGPLVENTNFQFHDGVGENIATLNENFGELTAHYWVLKNLPPTRYIGFCHYRRYFNLIPHPQYAIPKVYATPSREIVNFLGALTQRDRAIEILNSFDIITTRQYVLNETISQQFCVNHSFEIWDHFKGIMKQVSPNWLVSVLDYFDISNEFRFYPVFITRWDIFVEFSSLLFDVLIPLRERIGSFPISAGVRFQLNRYPAYLSERFFMLYIFAKRLKVYGAQLITLEPE